MKGSGIGELRLTFVQGRKLPGTTLWQYGTNIPNTDWSQATVPINSSSEYQLLFIGVVGTSYAGDIAIDDITFTREKCPLTPAAARPSGVSTVAPITASTKAAGSVTSAPDGASCNFETGLCGWTNTRSGDVYDWGWGKTASALAQGLNVIPAVDHTLNSGNGRYLYYDMNQKNPNDAGSKAMLLSPVLPANGIKCLSYWYNMASNVRKLEVNIKSGSSLGTPVQRLTGVQASGWVQTSISITPRGSYQIVFTGYKGVNNIDGVIALDDIVLTDGQCLTSSSQSNNLCTFEADVCSFTQDKSDDYDWARDSRGTATLSTGPSVDHTYGTGRGSYMYAEASGSNRRAGEVARMSSPSFPAASGDQCLVFYYHMFGSGMGTLNVRMETGANQPVLQPVLWSMSGNLGNQWKVGEVTLPRGLTNDWFKVVFEAVRGANYYSDIAVDDVSVANGACASKVISSFFHLFYFHHVQNQSRLYPIFPTLPFSSPTVPYRPLTHFTILATRLPPTDGGCFTFWYHMVGTGIGSLNIVLGVSPTQNTTLWTLSGPQENKWSSAQVPIISPKSSFFIFIEGVRGSDYHGDIAVDDVGYHNTLCAAFPASAGVNYSTIAPVTATPPPTGSIACHFDRDFCNWKQETSGDVFDWQRQASRADDTPTGPTRDHSGVGSFAFIDSSDPRKEGDTAILTSPVLSGDQCVTFWYFMWGDHVRSLKVYQGPNKASLIWVRTGSQGKAWTDARIHLAGGQSSYQIEATVGTGARGDIAIDDISVAPGNCLQSSQGVPIATCDFEKDLCNYKQESSDAFNWTRHNGRTASSNTGPSVDHTYGTAFASPKPGDLRLSGPPSGQGAGGGARTRDRRVPADLRADSLATEAPTHIIDKGRRDGLMGRA
ncbi:MAM and LDL-receptor class a domain-containing protein 1-like [Plakobranchus ocellatus]|uniref:MAM and LDL-receptor class a domain-containing protein 1-like n=1 Tax=Plakobranchus ocellatus TaxID=259542 RepID=A0AAV3YQM8_9GAST|nr:MAM and LDL-receptor class a domain-containing protein 1-like [Plakobranchus ocellatus]